MEQLAFTGVEHRDPRFEQLNRWTSLLFNVVSAKRHLASLNAEFRLDLNASLNGLIDHQGIFFAFINSYWRCFGEAKGRISLQPSDVFGSDPRLLEIHARIKHVRHKAAAHNGESGLDDSAIAVIEFDDRFEVSQKMAFAIPLHEYDGYLDALTALEEHVVDRMKKHEASLEKRLGKTIKILRS